mgnify:CR=1 FL=1
MTNEELLKIKGGSIKVTLLNSIARILNSILELGRTAGTSVHMYVYGKTCR